jgi:predicted DNA-binding protein YlxM (UPF0122 family)
MLYLSDVNRQRSSSAVHQDIRNRQNQAQDYHNITSLFTSKKRKLKYVNKWLSNLNEEMESQTRKKNGSRQ